MGKTIISLNKGFGDVQKTSKLMISGIDEVAKKIDDFNKTRKSIEKLNTWKNNIGTPDNTIDAFLLQHATDKDATLEDYNKFLASYTKGWSGVNDVIHQYNAAIRAGNGDQVALVESIKEANPELHKYLNSLDGAKAGILGYGTALVGAKAKTMALQAASMLLNAAISIGVSFAIQGVIKLLDNLITTQKECAESARQVMNAYQEARSQLSSMKKTIDDITADYKRLSRGVDDFGNITALSTDEQERYHEITNKIADMFPEMVKGYDDEGNAIIRHKGSVDALTDAYEKQAKAAKEALILGSKDIFNNFKNQTGTSYWSKYWGTVKTMFNPNQQAFSDDDLAYLKRLTQAKPDDTDEDLMPQWINNPLIWTRVYNSLVAAGVDKWEVQYDFANTVRKNKDIIQSLVDNLETEAETATQSVRDVVSVYLEKNTEYDGLSQEQKDIINNVVSDLGSEFFSEYGTVSGAVSAIVDKFVKPIENTDLSDGIYDAIGLKNGLENDEVTIGEYEKQIDELFGKVGEFPKEQQKNVKYLLNKLFGDAEKDFDPLAERLRGVLDDEFGENVESLTLGELNSAMKVIDDAESEIEKKLTELGKGGNVDLLVRPVIDTKELNKAGWNEPDAKATVLTNTFSNESGTKAINFTPIIVDENGKYVGVLSPEELQQYAEEVIAGTREDDKHLQIGAEFTGENAVAQAETAAKKIHQLHEQYLLPDGVLFSWDELISKIKEVEAMKPPSFNLESVSKSIDDIQSAYKSMKSAIEEYNKEGYISVDNFQSLITLDSKYLKYLTDEEGQLRLDTQAMEDLTIARIKELVVQQKQELIKLAESWADEAQAQEYLANQVKDTTSAYEDQFQARLQNLQAKWVDQNWSTETIDEVLGALRNNLSALDSLQEKTIDGIMNGLGMTGESAYDTNKKLEDTQRQIADLDKKANLDRIKHKFDVIEQSVDKLNNTMSLLDNTLDLISEDDHIGKIQTTTLQLDLARTKAGMLADEFNELQNTEYDSADAANELATRMKSVTDEIASNQKNIIEYGKNIAQYYGDALRAIGTLSKTQIDEASNLLDRNIKSLEEGGLIGLSFSLSPVATPQSAIEKQRQENKTLEEEMQAHYNAVENMQKIALDMRYQETMADYARQREELVKSLNEIKTTLGNNSTEVQGIEGDKNKKVLEAEKKSNQERLAEEKSFSDQSKGVINDLNNWMKTNPIVAPSLDTTAWDGLVSKAEEYAKKVKDAVNGAQNIPDYPANTKASDIAKAAVTEAKKYEGVPYVWGGTTPNGFDCSGLVQYAMKQAGNDIPRVADDQWHDTKGAKITDMNKLQYGDLVFFGSHDYATHVGMYVGDGQMLHAPHTGDVVKYTDILNSDYYKSRFLGARRYYDGTGTFDYDGIAGETYEPEYLIDKKTGKATRVTSPTPVNTKTTDVVGVKQTKELEKHKYANGTVDPMDIAKYIRGHYPEVTDNAIAGILGNIAYESSFDQFNKTVEEYGGGNKSLIARRGLFQLDDTRIPNWSSIVASGDWTKQVDTVLAEGRYQNSGMGNSKKHNMWQYLTDSSLSAADVAAKWDSLYERSDGKTRNQRMDKANEYLSQIKSLGLSMDASTSTMSNNVAAIARQDVATRVNEIITGNKQPDTATRESVEDSILEFIQNNLPEAEDTTNTLIEKFGALQQVTNEYNDSLEADRQRLLDSVGTDNYNAVRAEIGANAQAKTNAIIAAQVDYELVAVKDNFDRSNEVLKLAYDYYNDLVAKGAPTQAISAAANTIAEIEKQRQEYSDTYVSTMQKLSETMLKTTTRELKAYDDRISWIDKSNSELEQQVQNAASTTEKTELLNKQLANNVEKSQLLDEKMSRAHQGNEDLRHDSRYAEIFDAYDTYAWFDAEGNATARYELDRLTMSPETVTLLEALFPILQKNTQEWQAAKEESEQVADNTKNINKELAQSKIEVYTENLERLNEIDEVRKGKQDAITSAMQQQHSLAQSLREEISNINAELDANKHTEQWLDEDTRKLIFNDEDYEAELKAINDIQAQATREYNRYKAQIAGLNETEWYQEQKITDEYNKRMDVLNEQLQVEKDKLAVKKKELEYNNALKERDTRIIIGGRSVQVANPDTMYNLAKERSQAQSDLNNTLLKNSETEQERQSDRISQSINQEIETRNKMVELIGKMSEAEQELFVATLPVIQELEIFKEALSPQNIPWLNSHSRDFRDDFVDMPELYKHGGYNQAHDYAGDYPVIEQLYQSGIIRDEVYEALTQQAENQHNWKRSTDVNTAQYPYTSHYGRVNYGAEYYGINDEDKWAREQAKEYSQLAYEINHGFGTQAQLDRIKELNDSNAKDNKYIANTLDTTLYTVNEDGIVVRGGQKIGLDSDSIQEFTDAVGNRVGEIVKGAVVTSKMYRESKKGDIAHGDYTPRQSVGEIAHGNYNAYKSGTDDAKPGWALTDEDGYEFKLKKLGGQYRLLQGHEKIFTAGMTENLEKFSINPPNYIQDMIDKTNAQMTNVVTTHNNDNRTEINYNMGGVTVNNPFDGNGFIQDLTRQCSGRYDITKNTRN